MKLHVYIAYAMMFASGPVDIDLSSCVHVRDVVATQYGEVTTIKTLCTGADSSGIVRGVQLARTYPNLNGANPDNPDGQTIIYWGNISNDENGESSSISDFLENLRRQWEIDGRFQMPNNLPDNG